MLLQVVEELLEKALMYEEQIRSYKERLNE